MSLKIRIDGTKCRGHGLCALAAPNIFEVVGLGIAKAADVNLSDPREGRLVARAIKYCVEDAIRLEERGC